MPTLKNPRHERFAQELAAGKTQGDAYQVAGFKPHRGNAHALVQQQHISDRVAELLSARQAAEAKATEIAIERAAVSKEWIIEKLRENVERSMQAIAVFDRDGEPTGEYRYDGGVANRALELLGKEHGMFIDRKIVDANLNVKDDRANEVGGILGELFEAPTQSADDTGSGGKVVH